MNDTEVIEIQKDGHVGNKRCTSLAYPAKVTGAAEAYLSESNTNIICGGYDERKDLKLKKCYKLNTASMLWDEVNSLNIGRSYHAMASIGQTVITCGGYTNDLDGYQKTSSCEKLTNGKWTMISPLPTEKVYNHCMLAIDNSTILLIGGDRNWRVRKIKLMLNIKKVLFCCIIIEIPYITFIL